MKKSFVTLLLLGAGISAYAYYSMRTVKFVPEVTTVTVSRGVIADTVGATGTLEAVTTVQVGSQVSGIIMDLYADFNSIVRQGEVIARLDPSLFETQIEQARANLVRAEADVERQRVAVEDARANLTRAEGLALRNLIPQTELDAARVSVRSGEAQLRSSLAQVTQAEASLNQNEVNLEHTVITAPIDGIVISRAVDVGQTVAASMSAPELFVLAADLTKMRVIANIDEADVGRIRPGQTAIFTVDAYPADEFEGTVSQIRLNPVVLQNVVTYATVIDVPNPDLRLKPGMTATVTLETARRDDALRIPNTALRFRTTPGHVPRVEPARPREAPGRPTWWSAHPVGRRRAGRGGRGGQRADRVGSRRRLRKRPGSSRAAPATARAVTEHAARGTRAVCAAVRRRARWRPPGRRPAVSASGGKPGTDGPHGGTGSPDDRRAVRATAADSFDSSGLAL